MSSSVRTYFIKLLIFLLSDKYCISSLKSQIIFIKEALLFSLDPPIQNVSPKNLILKSFQALQ